MELGRGVRTPEGLRGWILGKNDNSDGWKQCLTYYELSTVFGNSNITNAYEFRDAIRSQAATMEFAQTMASDVADLKFRESFSSYLRTTARQFPNELAKDIDGEMQIHMATL